jgi:hypothetical protein
MLERALGQACVGALTAEWPWTGAETTHEVQANPLPFDCVLFVNSAAPSVHTKELADLCWAHQQAFMRVDDPAAQKPILLSVTSSADWATRGAHYWANLFARWMPSLQRVYTNGVLDVPASHLPVPVRQSYFYRRTPGHNILLLDHWVVPAKPAEKAELIPEDDPASVIEHNLRANFFRPEADCFYTSEAHGKPKAWRIATQPANGVRPRYKDQLPVTRGCYWIIRCDGDIIKNHGDVWNQKAMELYAALYLLTEGGGAARQA